MADYVAAYDDVTKQLLEAQQDLTDADTLKAKAITAREVAYTRVVTLQNVQLGLGMLSEVVPVLAKREAEAAIAQALPADDLQQDLNAAIAPQQP